MRLLRFVAIAAVSLATAVPAMAIPSRAMFAYTNALQPGDVQLILDGFAINAFDSGWYTATGNHNASNDNYVVGLCGDDACLGDSILRNNYFAFDIPDGEYTTAVLRLMNPPNANNSANGYISTESSELYSLFSVETAISTLTATQAGQVGIYDDLGSGTFFGSRIVSAADNGTWVQIDLNSDALAAIGQGGEWAIGGTLSAAPVPEPSSLLLLGAGLVVCARRFRRRR